MDAREGQDRAGHLGLVAHLAPGGVGEGSRERVLGPVLIDGTRLVYGHRLPRRAAVVAGEPAHGRAAGDVHLGVDLRGLDALGQFVLAREVGAGRLVQVADQVHVAEVERGRVVGQTRLETDPHQRAGGEIRQPLLLGGNDGAMGPA